MATVFDSLELARTGQQLQGTISVADLTRLADSLFDTSGDLTYRITGHRDSRGRPRLALSVAGEINLRCQRCLGKLPHRIDAESDLLVLTDNTTQSEGLEDLDGVAASEQTDAVALVEDEVLLNVPFAPRHADGMCSAAVDTKNDKPESPFAVLANLKEK
jgi:uncharacterized protein